MSSRFWVIVASKDHVMRGKSGSFCQACHGKRTPMVRLKPGDKVVFYSSVKEFGKKTPALKSFTALGTVIDNEPYQASIEGMSESFWRRDVKFEESAQDVEIAGLLPQLKFATQSSHWGLIMRRGFFEICKEDYELISERMLFNAKK